MKSTELMIGDWVYIPHNGKAPHYGKVTALLPSGAIETEINGSFALSSSVEPIPLTREILEKNGFSFPKWESWWRVVDCNPTIYLAEHNESWWLYQDDYLDSRQYFAKIKYVHELQHAFRLCGIEKEITI